ATDAFASDPLLACWRIVSIRSEDLPSCRKKMRWPRPHSGAVRNSEPVAAPCESPSARFEPMSCSSRSEKRLTALFERAALALLPVIRVGVWQRAQPTVANNKFPPALAGWTGAGGARNCIKAEKDSTSLCAEIPSGALGLASDSGVGLNR